MQGKLIVIEGIDCSGKNTQTNLLIRSLREKGIQVEKFSFPNYDTPTGKIIGGPYLGKENMSQTWFEEGPIAVDPKVASLYYAADRKYNIHKIIWLLEHGIHVILDRYTYSNMAHQASKIEDKQKRYETYQWLESLEFNLLQLPKPDIAIFLHMPIHYVNELKQNRELLDLHEINGEYLNRSERAYLELADLYHFHIIECAKDSLRTIESIHEEIMNYIEPLLKENA